MARLEATAVGGYYPTPPEVVTLLSQHLRVGGGDYAYVDPCAGEGSAIMGLVNALHGTDYHNVHLYAAEMEKERQGVMVEELPWRLRRNCILGDAFQINWQPQRGASLLYLNPPYDFDDRSKRLEEAFLARFASILIDGGILVFIVPFYALAASASTLGKSFCELSCIRFPQDLFNAFKQVVLVAKKRAADLLEPDPVIVARVEAWAKDPSCIAPIETWERIKLLCCEEYEPVEGWRVAPLDVKGLIENFVPWHYSDRVGQAQPMTGIIPRDLTQDPITRTYPVAMPPRSAHIAAGIAAGLFNGARIEPDKSKALPPLLVKGVFDKEFKTVDEKRNKKGEITALVQVQQPKLVTTVLDLHTGKYHIVKPTADVTGSTSVEHLTMADLLSEYGQGLMRTMLDHCPVLHNPKQDRVSLPKLARPLFRAQAHAAQAAFKLLGGPGVPKRARRFRSALVLGEIGSGKTSMALAVLEAIEAKRTLVMCPPHLLTSWEEQIQAVTPWIRTVVVSNTHDVQTLASTDDRVIAILSRETAKLGHSFEGLRGRCPKCGAPIPKGDHGKSRSRCQARPLLKINALGNLVEHLALSLLPAFPKDPWLCQIVTQSHIQKVLAKREPEPWSRAAPILRQLILTLSKSDLRHTQIAMELCAGIPEPELILEVVNNICNNFDPNDYSTAAGLGQVLLLSDSPVLLEKARELASSCQRPVYFNHWRDWEKTRDQLWLNSDKEYYRYGYGLHWSKGKLCWGDYAVGEPSIVLKVLGTLAKENLQLGSTCGELLFQATPQPRRFPVASFISKHFPRLFDFLILDEGHEYSSRDSAQSHAAHRLTALGMPTLLLTGTIMNGYAESLFVNTWSLNEGLRSEFDRNEQSKFVIRYGYQKRIVEEKDASGKVVAFGSMTDRVTRSERTVGRAPGILPLFLFRHLLPMSVTLHKSDLSADIPDCSERSILLAPSEHQIREYRTLQNLLLSRIRGDMFKPELSGKLWGALAQFPSYLDLATEDTGRFKVGYPASVGGEVLREVDPLPASTILPKEEWMLSQVERSLGEGRQVMIFAWHTVLLPRLARLVKNHLGIKCPVLDPAKVTTAKRQAWIDKQVVKSECKVLVVNPVAIQTGLNNLVYFSDEIWMENPACNPIIYRQAVGRVDRIGQRVPTRIFFPVYSGTAQEDLHKLLLHKVAVSMSTDGLDSESALLAAGIGEDSGFSSLAIGRQLYQLIAGPDIVGR